MKDPGESISCARSRATSSFWSRFPSWDLAESAWDKQARQAQSIQAIKTLTHRPQMLAMTAGTRKGFRFKALRYLLTHDEGFKLLKALLRHPWRYGRRYIRSLWHGVSFKREGDFFWYGLENEQAWIELYKSEIDLPVILGFSYCHKPFECPDGRFSDRCRADSNNLVCQQCFIGKMVQASPKRMQLLFIPTVHYIAEKVFEAMEKSACGRVLFLITACEMTLEMFGDWGNAVGIEGIGVRLEGRICNTMQAFVLSEKGIKPGLTLVDEPTQEKMLNLLKQLRN